MVCLNVKLQVGSKICILSRNLQDIFNRPGVAGAVLHTASSLIN